MTTDEEIAALREALVYARDRRGTRFDYDEWSRLCDAALSGHGAPSALENEIAAHGLTQAALAIVRAELANRDAVLSGLMQEITDLQKRAERAERALAAARGGL